MNAKLLCTVSALATAAALSACSLDSPTQPQIECADWDVATDTAAIRGDTVVTNSGVKYLEVTAGTGQRAEVCAPVITHYALTILGQDSVLEAGDLPVFYIGTGTFIEGFEQGIVGMQEQRVRRIIVPPELANGANGNGPIPPNATLVFDVTLNDAGDPIE
ncbi:MAG TPA: FKBP-type peptidyl-prolyl cis-trans isomerase [Longimicrobiaceae bacterium]|nr:FKBP-type peptidyl-prolyl cis-trans isomerase [Longimicrobiaceae bacterium]